MKGNDAIVKRAMTPAQQQQECLRIDDGNNAIIMRATIQSRHRQIACASMATAPS
jgi:hypothetical protein